MKAKPYKKSEIKIKHTQNKKIHKKYERLRDGKEERKNGRGKEGNK